MVKRPALLLLILGLAVSAGCDRRRQAYLAAARAHRDHIARVSAFAPFLLRRDSGEASFRAGAKAARTEIVKHASAAYDHFGPVPRPPATPTERIAAAFQPLRQACAVRPDERREDEPRHVAECRRAIETTAAALLIESDRARALGLADRILPAIGAAAVTPEAERAAEALRRSLSPSTSELTRRRVWGLADTPYAQLRKLCADALAESRGHASYEDIRGDCQPLQAAEEVLRRLSACKGAAGARCLGRSQCLDLNALMAKGGLPQSYRAPLERAKEQCM